MGKGWSSSLENEAFSLQLDSPTIPQLGILTGCNLHSGNETEIRRLLSRYYEKYTVNGFYINKANLKHISRDTPIQNLEDEIFAYFTSHNQIKVNMLEMLSAIIIYSINSWKGKVGLLFKLCDFDGNKFITRDEMTILCSAFLKGFGRMTGEPIPQAKSLERISALAFEAADRDPDNKLTLDE
jgi:hypothetical protein